MLDVPEDAPSLSVVDPAFVGEGHRVNIDITHVNDSALQASDGETSND